jgi:hypothetical protein
MADATGSVFGIGDRARIVVRGGAAEHGLSVLRRLAADPNLREQLVPSPVPGRAAPEDFGDLTAMQEFIIAAGAGVTAEALIAAVRAVLQRPKQVAGAEEPGETPTRQITVTATPIAPGVIEISVTLEDPGRR